MRPDPADLAPAALGADEFEAQTKAAVLKAEEIDAFVFPAARAWTGGIGLSETAQGVPVWVKREDLERAKEVLRQRIEDSVDLDWDEVDVGEREDTLPLRPVTHIPLLAKAGFALAAAIVITAAVVAIITALW